MSKKYAQLGCQIDHIYYVINEWFFAFWRSHISGNKNAIMLKTSQVVVLHSIIPQPGKFWAESHFYFQRYESFKMWKITLSRLCLITYTHVRWSILSILFGHKIIEIEFWIFWQLFAHTFVSEKSELLLETLISMKTYETGKVMNNH